MQGLNWNSYYIDDAVAICLKEAKGVAETQTAVKGHISQIQTLLKSWSDKLIVERKAGQARP